MSLLQNEFSIVLPSNSSMKYFPDNTTTSFSTRLPKELELTGKWMVGISEIHVPCTILHVRRKDAKIADDPETYFAHGTYESVQILIRAINEALAVYHKSNQEEMLYFDEKGGYVSFRKFPLKGKPRTFLSNIVKRIIGFEGGTVVTNIPVREGSSALSDLMILGKHPACLARALPDQLFVYSNICEPSIVGDTHATLLRIVNLEARKANFGTTIVKRYSPITYVPVLSNRFQIVDIDIRDQFGNNIPFEFGTLTVTLHFKREF